MQWPEPQADRIALLNSLDGLSGLRNGLRKVAEERNEWAGIPMPLEGQRLIVEPTYPKARELMEIGAPQPEPGNGETIRNQFWSVSKHSTIIVWQDRDGRIDWGVRPGVHHFDYDLQTLICSDAWGVEQEGNAVRTLGTLVTHRQFRQYMLTGMFMESSKRSHVMYMFRRLKPTVAIATNGTRLRILCTLCQHPIGYYAGAWAGAMCPTDDVIAHLVLMRGDEHMFWKRSNQHPPHRPEAGL